MLHLLVQVTACLGYKFLLGARHLVVPLEGFSSAWGYSQQLAANTSEGVSFSLTEMLTNRLKQRLVSGAAPVFEHIRHDDMAVAKS